MLRAIVLVVALLLAGCARAPEPAATPEPAPDATTRPASCPDGPGILWEKALGPPGWQPGMWWNYTALDESELARGYALYEVTGCADVDGALAYRVQETWLEYGSSMGYPEAPRVADRFFEIETLNEVWARCDEPRRGMYPCEGRLREWDFPLQDGKRWTYVCCSDLPRTVHARAELAPNGTWRIQHSTEEGGAPWRTWIYDPARGLFTDKIGDWWNGPGRWELRASGEGSVPQRGLPEDAMQRAQLDLSCVHPEARGPATSTNVRGAWQASPEGMIVRLARALDEQLVGEPSVGTDAVVRWNASSGGVFESPLRAGPTVVTWRAASDPLPRSGPGGEAWLRGVLERFAFADAHGIEVRNVASTQGYSFWYSQRAEGMHVRDAGGYVETAGGTVLHWGPIYDLPEVTVGFADARAAAESYHRCDMDGRGLTEENGHRLAQASETPTLVVHQGSLAYEIVLAYEQPEGTRAHCPFSERVLVDAITGAILGRASTICI